MLFAVIAYGAFEGVFGCDPSLGQACSLPLLPFCRDGELQGAERHGQPEHVFCDRDACGVVRGALKRR